MSKKKIIVSISLLVIVFLLILIISTTKQNDWYYMLSNDYEIWHVNSKENVIGKREDDILTDVIEDDIIKFKYNNDFVIIKCLSKDNEYIYYIINMNDNITYGPYNNEEYLNKEKELNIDIDSWINTDSTPKGAKYN